MTTKTSAPLRALTLAACLAGLWLSPLACADEPASAVGPLMKLYQSGRLPAERQAAVVEMICNRGNEHDLRVVFEKATAADGMPAALRLKALGWLGDAVRNRKLKPAGDLAALESLIQSDDPAVRLAALKLASAIPVPAVAPTFQKLAADAQTAPELQRAAIAGLVAVGGKENQAVLRKLAADAPTIEMRIRACAACVAFDVPAAAQLAVPVLAAAGPDDDPAPLLDAFFDRKDGTTILAEALATQKLAVDPAKRALRYMYSVGRSDAALSTVLSEAAGIAADPPPPTPEEVARIVKDVVETGDAARGERIFRRADLSCMRCHSVSRAGGQVGPELSAVGGSSPVDYVVNSILNPNLAVKEQFVTRVFETAEGKVLTGIVIDRDDARVRIKDVQGQTLIIPTADIEDEVEGASMMPSGLTKFLTRSELLDLARFISELGKPGPYAVRTNATIQRWRRMAQPPAELTADVPHLEHLRQFVLDSPPELWAPVYGKVDGVLPLDELRKGTQPTVVILYGEIQVNEAGTVTVDVASTEKVQVWLDAQGFEGRTKFDVPLEPGRHKLILRVEISDRAAPELKVELTRPADGGAQFEVIGGA